VLSTPWDTIIMDEAHNIRGADTIRQDKIIPMLKRAKHVLLLTATPQETGPANIFNPLSALFPEIFNDREAFVRRYANAHFDDNGEWNERGSSNEDELHIVLKQFMLRVTQAEAMPDLPPKTEYLVHFKVKDEKVLQGYQGQAEEYNEICENERKCAKFSSERLYWTRKKKQQANKLIQLTGVIKAELIKPWIIQTLENNPTEKMLIFFMFMEPMDIIEAFLKEKGIGYIRGDGNVSIKKRQELIEPIATNDQNGIRVALLSLRCFSDGINARPGATIVLFHGYASTAEKMRQGAGRVHRFGTERPCSIQWTYCSELRDKNTFKKLMKNARETSKVVNRVNTTGFNFLEISGDPEEAETSFKHARIMDEEDNDEYD